jgi:hypothetical protein
MVALTLMPMEPRGVHVLRHGAHGLAHLGALYQQRQGDHGGDGNQDGHGRREGELQAGDLEIDRRDDLGIREAARVGAQNELRHISRKNDTPITVISRLIRGA